MTTYTLGTASRRELAGVHPRLVAVVARGAGQTMDSKHLPQAGGYGYSGDMIILRFTGTALVCDGTNWVEISRSTN